MKKLGDKARDVAIEHVKQKAARDIITRVRKWRESKISTAKRRWIFELIQNAIDTAKARGSTNSKIEITTEDNKVVFRHNGGYFTLDEISAIIYGGSTKPYSPELEYIGRFGSGFLVSHILNRGAKVSGSIIDETDQIYRFDIALNRTPNEQDELSKSIDKSFEQLNNAIKQEELSETYTEYVYDVIDQLGQDAVKQGVSELKKVIPLLFAFNDIDEIVIDGEPYSKSVDSQNGIQSIITGQYQVRSKKDGDAQVAILLEKNGIANLRRTPKIFVGLPLTETADYINIPFIINSIRFEPTEERDSLNNTDDNRAILKKAFTLYYELLRTLIENEEKPSCLHNLVEFSLIPVDRTEQNPILVEFNNCLRGVLEKILSEISMVETYEGYESVNNVIFPVANLYPDREAKMEREYFERFYNILKEIRQNIPTDEVLRGWITTAITLKGLSDGATLYTLKDLKDELKGFVEGCDKFPEIIQFGNKFSMDEPKQFFVELFGLIDDLYKQELIDSSNFMDYLLLDQDGIIGPHKFNGEQLYIEDNIPEDLKDIIHKVGWEIRQNLVDNDFAHFKIVMDYVSDILNVDKVIEKLLRDRNYWLGEKIEDEEGDGKVNGWIELFRWCITNDKVNEGFPLITKDNKRLVMEDLNKEAFFLPFKYIGIDEEYEAIYPENRILHQRYFETSGSYDDFINALRKYKVFVTTLPIHKNGVTLRYNKLKSILAEDGEASKVDHKLDAESAIIAILPFWDEVIGKISDYPERAKLLFNFIIKYVMGKDESYKNQITVRCSCKDKCHKIIPTQWLASIETDTWIPVKSIEDEKEDFVRREATRESIEKLFGPDELEELIKTYPDRVTTLFPHFGFDELDLMIKLHSIKVGVSEEQMRKDVSKLVDIAEIALEITDLAKEDPEGLRQAIETLKEKQEKNRIKVENKIIGENLEIIIGEIIRNKDFEVVPKYIGGDLEIWPEEIEGWDSGLVEITPYLIEVKFTSGRRVHLSKAQSAMASERKNYYYVLVVESAEDLREQLKVVEKHLIGPDLIDSIVDNSFVVENIHKKLGSFPNPEEVEPDINGYWIKKKLWKNKTNVLEWLESKFCGVT